MSTSGELHELQKQYEADKDFLNKKKKLATYYEKNITASSSPDMLQLFKFFKEHKAVKDGEAALVRVLAGKTDTQEILEGSGGEDEIPPATPAEGSAGGGSAAAAGGGKK